MERLFPNPTFTLAVIVVAPDLGAGIGFGGGRGATAAAAAFFTRDDTAGFGATVDLGVGAGATDLVAGAGDVVLFDVFFMAQIIYPGANIAFKAVKR